MVRSMSENLTNLSTALLSINERLETLTTTLQAEKDTLKQENIDLGRQIDDARRPEHSANTERKKKNNVSVLISAQG